ncbi:MAG: tryptophan synthase subunit alpha [Ignavibacteriales bacterium]
MSAIKDRMTDLRNRDERALIGFMMAGLPNASTSLDCIKAVEQGGCDLLELGVPFSDPVADGPLIEELHHRGVEMSLNLPRVMDFAAQVRNSVKMPLILFCYYNPIYQMGLERFMKNAGDIGISGVIIPDLPLDEFATLQGYTVEPIPMVAPSSSDARLQLAADLEPGFVYCVSVKGVTGVRSLPEEEIKSYLQRVRSFIKNPLALGFGISGPEQIRAFKAEADAYVVGSHLARIMNEETGQPTKMAARLQQEMALLKAAAR